MRPELHRLEDDESCAGEVIAKRLQGEETARMKGEEFELLRALTLQCPTSPDVQAPMELSHFSAAAEQNNAPTLLKSPVELMNHPSKGTELQSLQHSREEMKNAQQWQTVETRGQGDFHLGNRRASKSLKDPVLFLPQSLPSESLVLLLWQVLRYPASHLRNKRKNLLQYPCTPACTAGNGSLANTLK